jgi:cytochrome c oxidase cbb3-type subunit 3
LQPDSKEKLRKIRGRKKMRAAAVAIVAFLGLIAAGVYLSHDHDLKRRLLMATPDSIPDQQELVDFALPIGKKAYAKHCAECHGADLTGDQTKGVPNLVDNDFLYGTGRLSDIERVVMYGIRSGNSKGWDLAAMPAYGTRTPYPRYELASLSPREIDDLVAYLRSFENMPDDQDAVKRGEEIYRGYKKGVCWDCHATDVMGDSAIGAPNLTDTVWLYGDGSAEWIKDAITYGMSGTCPAWIDQMPMASIRSIAVYIHSLLRAPGTHTAAADTGSN